jgi:hypothetical protein
MKKGAEAHWTICTDGKVGSNFGNGKMGVYGKVNKAASRRFESRVEMLLLLLLLQLQHANFCHICNDRC